MTSPEVLSREAERLHRQADSHWWHVGRRRVVARLVHHRWAGGGDPKPLVLEVGCGVGNFWDVLASRTTPIGLDWSFEALRRAQGRGYRQLLRADVLHLPVRTGSVEGLLIFDVLEHVKEDAQVLRECFRCLQPGGTLIVTVPACPWLWSDLDEQVGHVRRYRRQELAHKIRHVGFHIAKLSYFNSVLFPALASVRLIQRILRRWIRFDSSCLEAPRLPGLNRFLAACFGAEAGWLCRGRFPWGASLLCLAQKPQKC